MRAFGEQVSGVGSGADDRPDLLKPSDLHNIYEDQVTDLAPDITLNITHPRGKFLRHLVDVGRLEQSVRGQECYTSMS